VPDVALSAKIARGRFSARVASVAACPQCDPFGLLARIRMDSPRAACGPFRAFRPRAVSAELFCEARPNPSPACTAARPRVSKRHYFPSDLAPSPSSYRLRFRTSKRRLGIARHLPFPYLLTEFDLYLMGEAPLRIPTKQTWPLTKTLEGIIGVHSPFGLPMPARSASSEISTAVTGPP